MSLSLKKKNIKLEQLKVNGMHTTRNKTKKTMASFANILLKGKLFNILNKTNVMSEERYFETMTKISLFRSKKYQPNRPRDDTKKIYYAKNRVNILSPYTNSNKFEDDYKNAKEILKEKFTPKEKKVILSHPQFFQLNQHDALKELVDKTHRNLSELIFNEEQKEKQRETDKEHKKKFDKKKKINHLSPIIYDFSKLMDDNKPKEKKINKYNLFLDKSNNDLYSSNEIKKPLTTKRIFNTVYSKKTFNLINNRKNFQPIFTNILNLRENENISPITLSSETLFSPNKYNFHYDYAEKYKTLNLIKENKTNEKLKKIIERKEKIAKLKKQKLIISREKNKDNQIKKAQERLKIFDEKVQIDRIIKVLKKNYTKNNFSKLK